MLRQDIAVQGSAKKDKMQANQVTGANQQVLHGKQQGICIDSAGQQTARVGSTN